MDIAMSFIPSRTELSTDINMDGSDLKSEKDLETAIILSLFSDRRANPDDILEDEDRRGWWGDTFAEVKNDKFGSRLWLLRRQKITFSVLTRAKQYVNESLKWLVEDKIVKSINAIVEVVGERPNGVLGIRVEAIKSNGVIKKYDYVWEQI
jgi:phage gp46-like protein